MKKQTVNKILLSEKELIKSMTDLCFSVVSQGGSFEISNEFDNTWFTVFKINFPDDTLPESLTDVGKAYNVNTVSELIFALKARGDKLEKDIATISNKFQYVSPPPYKF